MQVEVKLEHSDFVAFNVFVLHNSREARRMRVKSRIGAIVTMLALAGIVLPCWYWIGMIETVAETVVFFIVFAVVLIPALIVLDRIFLKRRLKRLISEETDKSLLSRTTYSLSEDEIAFEGEFGDGRSTWKAVEDVAATDEHIFILLGKHRAYVFPKRAFASPEQTTQFFELAREYKAAHG